MALYKDVFKQQIWDFFGGDIESCLMVSKSKQVDADSPFKDKGGLNFTSVLVIFSVIELVAAWWKGREVTSADISEFMKTYFSKYCSTFSDQGLAKKFYDVFRNGLSHQWSPKASGVAMDFNNLSLIGKFKYGGEEIVMVNVPVFFTVVKQGFADFERDLDTNERMRALFETRYKEIVESDYTEMRILRGMFDNQN